MHKKNFHDMTNSKRTDSPPSHGVSSGLQSKAEKKAEIAYPSYLNKAGEENKTKRSDYSASSIQFNSPKYDSIPQHYVVILRSTTDSSRRVLLQPLEISHESLPSGSRHCHHQEKLTATREKT